LYSVIPIIKGELLEISQLLLYANIQNVRKTPDCMAMVEYNLRHLPNFEQNSLKITRLYYIPWTIDVLCTYYNPINIHE